MRLQSSCKCIIVSNHSVVAALQTVLTSPHLKSITENTGAVPQSWTNIESVGVLLYTHYFCVQFAVYNVLYTMHSKVLKCCVHMPV